MTPEGKIKNEILSWLFSRKEICFVWPNDSVGIWDPIKKTFRRKNSIFHINGVSDILGIWNGMPLAIEVKTKKGRLSEDQARFIHNFKINGGISFMARSLQEVMDELELYSKDL